jgi:hypothetical protein
MRKPWLKLALAAGLALVSAAAFAAYLAPGMVIEFANLVLCS